MGRAYPFPTIDFMGTSVDCATIEQAVEVIDRAIRRRKPLSIAVINAAKLVNMSKDELLRQDVRSSDLIFADGMSVVFASRFLGTPVPERIAGIDLMMQILTKGQRAGYRVFCLGATEEVSMIVQHKIEQDFPGVKVVGRRNGYFSEGEEEEIVSEIADLAPDVLLVAITSPKKERFMARWSNTLNVTVTHGVGGSFDVYAGKVKRAPERWQRLGLEWLFRVKEEPGRLWKRYLITNVRFLGMFIEVLFSRRSAESTPAERGR